MQKTIEDLRNTLHNLDVVETRHPDYKRYLHETTDYVQQVSGANVLQKKGGGNREASSKVGYLNTYGLVEGLDKQLRNVFGELWWKLRPNEHAALVKRLYMRGWDWKFIKVTSKSNEKEPDLFYEAKSEVKERGGRHASGYSGRTRRCVLYVSPQKIAAVKDSSPNLLLALCCCGIAAPPYIIL